MNQTEKVARWLQEMADIAQDQGMHPDHINAVCDAYTDMLEALKELLENGACYHSAIELDHGFNGERWETKALAIIAKAEG